MFERRTNIDNQLPLTAKMDEHARMFWIGWLAFVGGLAYDDMAACETFPVGWLDIRSLSTRLG